MHHMEFIIVMNGILCTEGKVSIFQKSQLSKIYWVYFCVGMAV